MLNYVEVVDLLKVCRNDSLRSCVDQGDGNPTCSGRLADERTQDPQTCCSWLRAPLPIPIPSTTLPANFPVSSRA